MTLDWPEPSGERRLGVIGWPVAHSLSPVLHRAAFEALGLTGWTYERLAVPPGEMAEAFCRLAQDGYVGANVTMPHKDEAAARATELSGDAAVLRAVNTLVRTSAGYSGHNTDAPGFAAFLREDTPFRPEGADVLIYGAGGAARAVALAVGRLGVATITVAVRDPARAATLTALVPQRPPEVRVVALPEAARCRPSLIVNATPVGAGGESLPLPPLKEVSVVVDLLYHPRVTPLLASAEAAGVPAYGGLGLLVHQAALSFELWTGRPAPLEAMRAAGEAAALDPGGSVGEA